ncbi:MAG: peptidoglycan-binding domain-containing protein, partial [Candidatus Falkowbacteria bacterium]|nr:peptidoglycan-binding domain-containing protein [Candidatus Falkowbacteria bacterium]
FGDQLIASVNHLTDFAIIRNVAVPDKVTEASKVDAAKTVSGECLLNNKIVSRLQEGSVNNQTKDVQELLKCLKYLPSDFKTSTTFAKTTTEGLKVFQKAKGVGPIGFFGTKTVNALNTYYKKTEVAKVEPKVTSKVTPKVTPKKKDDCGLDASLNTKLEKGASGEDVKKLQGLLQCLEYYPVNGKVTSYFGPTTTKALTAFQKAQGLTPNGSMSTQTKEALNKYKK